MTYKHLNGNDSPVIITPKIISDDRGYFYESFKKEEFEKEIGKINFVQENESLSSYGVFRGMHFQKPPYAQAKLVRVVKGAVIDFAVDIRKDSATYGQVYMAYLTGINKRQFFIPQGYAHGFLCLADGTTFQYKCDNVYHKESEGSFNFKTHDLLLNKVLEFIPEEQICLSNKDIAAEPFATFVSPFITKKDIENI